MSKRRKLRLIAFETPLKAFLRITSNGGLLLMFTALIAVIWANSPWQQWYTWLFEKVHFALVVNDWKLDMHLLHWINDGLMSLFFFMVGLEIKREILAGELNNVRMAALPMIAAVGGMVVPMVIFKLFALDGETSRGWGIPMATDIAFSIGILSMLGNRVPLSLKVFLTALAIVDDLGAVIVIAVFYTSQINWVLLAIALGILAVLVVLNILDVRYLWIYMAAGAIVWWLFLNSGVHATIAGVLVAFTIPINPRIDSGRFMTAIKGMVNKFRHHDVEGKMLSHEQIDSISHINTLVREVQSPLQFVEHSLHRFVNYFILPVFALSNAGIVLINFGSHQSPDAAFSKLSLALAVSLVLGKLIGIYLFSRGAVRLGIATKPQGASWSAVAGVALLGGIGFTMSLFIGSLAYSSPQILTEAKIGIFAGSILAGIAGYVVLDRVLPKKHEVAHNSDEM